MDLFKVYPLWDIDIVRAEGSYVWDDKGTVIWICTADMP